MIMGISFSTVLVVVILLWVFRRPVKTVTEELNTSLPPLMRAASISAVNSAAVAMKQHEKECREALQDAGIDESLEDIIKQLSEPRRRH